MSYSFERIGKLLEGRGLRLAALQARGGHTADKSWRAFISGKLSGKGGRDGEATAGVLTAYFICVPEKARISHWPLRFTQASPTAI